jgi:VWFA-related protein
MIKAKPPKGRPAMNRKIASFALLFFLILFASLSAQTEEPIKETVSVINVEVPVRVFSDGQSVPGLAREDFQVFEDGKPQVINGFHVFHKKINAAPETAEPAAPAQQPAGRYFVLIFRTYSCSEELEKGLQYLFDNVLRPQDQVLVMAGSRSLMFERLASDPEAHVKVLELVRSESRSAHNRTLNYLRSIEQNLNITQFRMKLKSRGNMNPDYLHEFLKSYLQAWQDFKRRYLTLELDKFYYFSRHLERIRKEKWVLNFYQLEQFPQIALGSDIEREINTYISNMEESQSPTLIAQGRILRKLQQSIEMEMKVTRDFPAEEASKLFYKVNATFHSFFMRAFYDAGNPELEFHSVASDIENSLRSLTEATGGTLVSSNDIETSLASIGEKADDYYLLTYEPTNAKKIGKIKVTVKDKKYKVLYDNNIRADYINEYLKKRDRENPSVKITELSFQKKKLSFVIRDFSLARIKGETAGLLMVRIRIMNDREQSLFDQSKSLKSAKKTFSLSLDFDFLASGKYDIIVDVLDQVSGKNCSEVIQPLVE